MTQVLFRSPRKITVVPGVTILSRSASIKPLIALSSFVAIFTCVEVMTTPAEAVLLAAASMIAASKSRWRMTGSVKG